MRCPSCEFENPEGMKFCGACATPLKARCPRCEFENPPGFKFCGACATALTALPHVAKSLELRAVMSLSRLWQQQSKQEEAHEMLAEIYNWFTEGFDTKDLQEAKALLGELG